MKNSHYKLVSLGKMVSMQSATNSSWLLFSPYKKLVGERNELKKELSFSGNM